MKRVLVFGGRGFVGSAVVQRLGERGSRLDVVPVSRRGDATALQADLTDPASLRAAIEPGDVVINCAGYARATDVSQRGRETFQRVNVHGVEALARACAERGAQHLLHISSVAAMGRPLPPDADETARAPVHHPYAESKRAAETALRAFTNTFPITMLRPTSVFGEGRPLAAVLCRLVSLPLVPLPDGGRAKIPYTYIGNVAEAVALALEEPDCHGGTFIVGDEQSYSLREIVEALGRGLAREPRILAFPGPALRLLAQISQGVSALTGRAPLIDQSRLATLTESASYSIRRFQRASGYEPPYSLGASAARIATWYQASRS